MMIPMLMKEYGNIAGITGYNLADYHYKYLKNSLWPSYYPSKYLS